MIKSVYKVYGADEESYFEVGEISVYKEGKVTKITYHEPNGTGDSHYCDIEYTEIGKKTRLFRPDKIEWEG